MGSGLNSLSLALFTTLTPAAIVAFLCAALPLLFFKLEKEERDKLNHFLAIPYAIALVGFIASATHLGTPSNALHVFWGIGRSPLSNEVFCAVIFLFVAGAYWMFTFRQNYPVLLTRVWLALACVAGIALVVMTSLAYSVETVLTWNSWLTPVNLWFSALLAGPVLGILTCKAAQLEAPKLYGVLCGVAAVSLTVGTVFLVLHYQSLFEIANYEFSADELVPQYSLLIGMHAISGVVGVLFAFVSLKKSLRGKTQTIVLLTASVLLLVAVFIPRSAFYALHMTAGF